MKPRFPGVPATAPSPAAAVAAASPGRRAWLVFAAIAAVYLAASLWRLDRPGLHYDEAFHASLAYKMIHPDVPWDLPVGAGVRWKRIFFVTTTDPFHRGPLRAALMALWFLAAPLGVVSLRLFGVGLGLFALWMTFRLSSRWFGAGAGLLATALLAADPVFIFLLRNDMHLNGVSLCLRLASLWAVDRLWSGGKWRAGAALGALTVAGLWMSGEYLWFLGGLVLAVAVVGRERWRKRVREYSWLAWVSLPLLGWLGLFIYADSVSPNPASSRFLERFLRVIVDLRVDEALRRLRLIGNTFNANFIETFYLGRPLSGLWLPFWEILVLALGLFLASPVKPWTVDPEGRQTRRFFMLCLPFFSMLLIVLTPPVYSAHHVIAIYPFLHIFVGAALAGAWPTLKRNARWGCAAVALFYFVGAAREVGAFHARFARGDVQSKWSPAINETADYLTEQGRPAVCLDWGLSHSLAVLTGGGVPLREVYYDPLEGFRAQGYRDVWRELFADPARLYVLHAAGAEVHPASRQSFFKLAREFGREPRLLRTVLHGGRPFIEVYEAVAKRKNLVS